jgi:PBP1b-binding outer membrane lipoprotein LpoB
MKRFVIFAVVLAFFAISCGGGTAYIDPMKDKGSREFGPKEVKMTVNKMVTSMLGFLKEEWKKPAFIQVKKFSNKTSEHIDTKMVSEEIQTVL